MKGSGPLVATVLVASTVALTSSSSAEVQHVSFSPTSSNQRGMHVCFLCFSCLFSVWVWLRGMKGLADFTQKLSSATTELEKAEAQIGIDVHGALNSALTG
ncbi:hypothetical protein PVK06_024768 [Gossypium arboreum]|uniref:Uncharacterized protein n=1 Tax=Gossypium arboreum TaxID=29729 RepID=A0ABR0PF14_GOSAR|nr:hypothetical protein PVK06_041445 [Gossypium arboreum]KAK5819745.1 hypothetical protein PVK06_024768 [Gossypium arboreum]